MFCRKARGPAVQELVGEHPGPPPFPPCPTAEHVSLLQGVEGPRGPPGARVSAPLPLGGLTGVSTPCSAPVQGGRCSLLFPPRRVTLGTEACQERR